MLCHDMRTQMRVVIAAASMALGAKSGKNCNCKNNSSAKFLTALSSITQFFVGLRPAINFNID